MNKTILVTGGAGFIGGALVRHLIGNTDFTVVNIDALTYAGSLHSLSSIEKSPRHVFSQTDICNQPALEALFAKHRPCAMMHLAAESHVDRSIAGPEVFVKTNIVGTFSVLEATRKYWSSLEANDQKAFRLLHISTDEVYGTLGAEGLFTEETSYKPNSPYSASKASSDHLVRAWHHTYGLPTLITNCSNNYGPFQFPEKLIPVVIQSALAGKPIPVYGKGANVRDWLFVDDHVRALMQVLTRGKPGETYNVGCRNERTNLELVRTLCGILDELRPNSRSGKHESLIAYITDRPGHDFRYAIDSTKVETEIGWTPLETFESGLLKTVKWYLENQAWCQLVASAK